MRKIKIVQSFNQNAVLALDRENAEVIIIGKGVGFAKKPGDIVDENKISKVFQFESSPQEQRVVELIKDISEDVILMTEDVVNQVQKILGEEMSSSFIVALASHIQFTLERNIDNLVIPSPFQYEMKYIYPKEYEAAVWAVAYLNKEYQLNLQETEIIFFTLHFVNGLQEMGEFKEVVKLSDILNDVTSLIDGLIEKGIDKTSIEYARFIVHLRYFVIRSLEKKSLSKKNSIKELYEITSKMFPFGQSIVKSVNQMLKEKHFLTYGGEEEFYLLLHITRLIDEGGNFKQA